MATRKTKYYVVWEGVEPGVYDNWEDARQQIEHHRGARYKSFATQQEAIEAYRSQSGENLDLLRQLLKTTTPEVTNYEAFPEIDINAIAVDASCPGNPGPVEYQCIELKTGNKLFKVGPYQGGTNNIGEYLAIVHALALLHNTNSNRTIYTDSRTAIAWIRNRRANTRLSPTPQNQKLLQLLQRADHWVQTHTWTNKIIKWDTDNWGEIPADFNRK